MATRLKKILLWSAGFVAAFLVVAIVVAPIYLNSASVKGRIQDVVSKKLGGKMSYERFDLFFFPRPHVEIKKLLLGYPRTFRGTLQSLSIYPQIMPLIKGELRFSEIQINEPNFRIILPAAISESTPEFPSLDETKANIRSMLAYLQSIGPGLIVDMNGGKFLLRRNEQDFLSLRNVTVHFNAPPSEMKVLVKATTERWRNFSLSGVYSFSEEKWAVRDLEVSIGRSAISGFSANLIWDRIPRMEILSGRVTAALDEIYSWLSSSESLTPLLRNVRSLHGALAISSMQISGPIDHPEAWRKKIDGEVSSLVAESPWMPAPVNVSSRFLLDDQMVSISGLSVRMGTTSLEGVSARFVEGRTPVFDVYDGRAQINLAEIFQWRNKYKALGTLLNDVKDLTGSVTLSSMRLSGPLLHPPAWRLKITGATKNIVINSSLLPAPLTMSGNFAAEENTITVSDTSVRLGESLLFHVTASITGREKPALEVRDGGAIIHLGEVFQWRTQYSTLNNVLQGVEGLDGTVTISSTNFKGPLFQPDVWKISAIGTLDHIVFSSSFLPGQIGLLKGNFNLVPDKLSFGLQDATILDSAVTGTALISGITDTLRSIDLTLRGRSGRKTLDWVFENLELPPALMIKTPLAISDSHLLWQKAAGLTFTGKAALADGPVLYVDLTQHGADFTIRHLTITDQETKASFTLNWQKQAADFSFSGLLAQATLSRIFVQGIFGKGTMSGDLQAVIRTDQPLRSRANGKLTGDNIPIPWGMPVPITVDKFALHAEDDILTVDSADITWGKNHYSVRGAATASDTGIAFSMALTADGIEIQEIQQALEQAGKKSSDQKVRSFPMPRIRGNIRANSTYVKFGRFTFAPAHAVITVAPNRVHMKFIDTRTCGISTPGTLLISQESISFDFIPAAQKEPLESTIDCLAGEKVHITGTFDLSSNIQAWGTSGQLLSTLEGRVDFKATDGKIYRWPTLQKIFSVLSVLEVFRGRAPQLGGNGFPYLSMVVQGDIHKGKFTVEKAFIGGQSLDLIAQGEIDLGKQKMDLTVLVAPFSTINWLIRQIPILGKIMGGTLITIPTRVSGDLANPDVVFLSPTAVGTRILNILENIINLPLEIISPILPKEKGTDEK
ncbi:MAG TPA: AsmA-like C-terminal domain-containing protein [Nitrospirota bacterium]|nr:AsmA-like C-terminal domain-containing protein [Nitrospirota bacterium]